MIAIGKKLSTRVKGVALEMLASDVATGAGQTDWVARVGNFVHSHSVEPFVNDGATPPMVSIAATTGVYTVANALPKIQQDQGYIQWGYVNTAAGQQSIKIGDNDTLLGSGPQLVLKQNSSQLTFPPTDSTETGALPIITTGANILMASVYNPRAEVSTDAFKMYSFDASGVLISSVGSYITDTVAAKLAARGIPLNEVGVKEETVFPEVTTIKVGAYGLVVFDTVPTEEELLVGLSAMALDPQSGCYSDWR